MDGEALPQFKPVRPRAVVAARWLHLYAYLCLAVLALDVWELLLLADPNRDPGVLDLVGTWNLTASAIQAGAYAIATILFLAWFFRLYSNLRSLSPSAPRFGTGWALASWFVPVLNLFRPKQMANDAWRASGPTDADADDEPPPALLNWWWGLWLLGGLLATASLVLGTAVLTYSELETGLIVDSVAQVILLSSAVLAGTVVRLMSRRQEARAASLAEDPS